MLLKWTPLTLPLLCPHRLFQQSLGYKLSGLPSCEIGCCKWHLWVGTDTVQYDNGDNPTGGRLLSRRPDSAKTHASTNCSPGWEPLPWTPPGLSTLGLSSYSPSTPCVN